MNLIYKMKFEGRSYKELLRIPKKDRLVILNKIKQLERNPMPIGVKKLKGRSGYRIRFGNYRIIYDVRDSELFILIIKVGHRKSIYV